ncbi:MULTISPECIES: MFS transporter [Nostocales]|uniref:MFS transporter n=3 Tax=Nostocales TaxID=1161 RepID=A0A0C1NKG0_9CYAN|nr:MFS transporter [Tolypothrix bouteillei]KAF3887669.1 MFS transporter [Tolypothrix bouteillei VB521301]
MNNLSSPTLEALEPLPGSVRAPKTDASAKISKQAIRTSLKASTIDGILASIFTNITSGVLLVNFLLELGATPVEIGLLSSIPMLVNFLQPLGAFIADRTKSRHWYVLAIFGPSRLLWLTLLLGIAWVGSSNNHQHQLVTWTLSIIFIANVLGALGSSAWFSWMAALVPQQLRGRYFGFRNSTASLTNLLCVPLLGFGISNWPGGTIQGFGVMLLCGVVVGIASLVCQFWMQDVNPQVTHTRTLPEQQKNQPKKASIFKDINFIKLLLYLGLWTFAVNLSTPFFNLYMMRDLALDLSTVTLYTSLAAGANLILLVLWGKLADRMGNRPLLLLVGILMAVTPIFWLFAGADSVSVWILLPTIHLLTGGSIAAIELCSSNIQMSVAPLDRPSQYFAIAAAVAGVSGGLGSTVGGFIAGLNIIGGLPGLFALSAVLRLIALLPLLFVQEPRSQSLIDILRNVLPNKSQPTLVSEVKI